jgi:hypothetical protein
VPQVQHVTDQQRGRFRRQPERGPDLEGEELGDLGSAVGAEAPQPLPVQRRGIGAGQGRGQLGGVVDPGIHVGGRGDQGDLIDLGIALACRRRPQRTDDFHPVPSLRRLTDTLTVGCFRRVGAGCRRVRLRRRGSLRLGMGHDHRLLRSN